MLSKKPTCLKCAEDIKIKKNTGWPSNESKAPIVRVFCNEGLIFFKISHRSYQKLSELYILSSLYVV